ncbi:MAG: hypothetical protein EG822_07345 [Deltaproteobacteria bacterium]|nr:hypothetical protein [Deltaproteobacteria bacterium]TLN01479.1 MAG: hypothetical protein FDZ73_15715 [bacterium]
MSGKISQQQASAKAAEILSALKDGSSEIENIDVSFILYLTEIISNRGTVEEPELSREMVNDIIAAMMKHGVNMHDWPQIISQLVKALHTVILYNIPDCYHEKAVALAAKELQDGFVGSRKEYFALLGVN